MEQIKDDKDEDDFVEPNDKKLTDWAKEPEVKDLKEDLATAKESHDTHVNSVKGWNDLRNITGTAKVKALKGRSSVQPKLIRRQAEWRYSALSEPFLNSDKMYKVEPRTFEDADAAKQNELVINWQFDTKINKVKFIDEYVRTTVDEGTSIVRIGWNRETTTVKVKNPIFKFIAATDEQQLQQLQAAVELKLSDPRTFSDSDPAIIAAAEYFLETKQPVIALEDGFEEVDEERIIHNNPTLDLINPENFYIDPACQGDYEKAKFIIISYETSKAELLKDGRFKNLKDVNWSGNTILGTPDHESQTPSSYQMKDDLRKPVVAHEYWGWYDVDGEEKLTPIVATWIGDVMIRMERNPFPDEKPPFVLVPYLPIKRSVNGEPDAELLEDNQKILGAVTRGMIDLMGRSANSQQGFAKGFLDVTNKRRFENGQDYEFNPGTDPRLSIFQHTYPEIPNSAMLMTQLQNQEAEGLTGVKSFGGGVSGEAYGEVAAGIKGVLDASSKREMNILRRLAKGMIDIGKKIIAMNAIFMSNEETIRITNKEFVKIKKEELQGNFDLLVDISTAEVDQAKSQDLAFMLQTMGPDMAPEMSRMILAEIATLKRMPTLAEKILKFEPQPDPMMQKMKELELMKLQKEIEEIDSKIALNNAKAQESNIDQAQKKLDYVEQDTGTKHARDLQKQSAQAKGNQSLEITKGLLRPTKEGETRPDVPAAIGYNELSKLMEKTDPDTGNVGF